MNQKELDKDSRKRLDKLADEWEKVPGFLNANLSPADLRLLLEHHAPLQELIRRIVAVELQATSSIQHSAVGIEQATPLALPAQDDTQALQEAEYALSQTQGELAQTKTHLQQIEATLKSTEAELAQAKQIQAEQEQHFLQKLTHATTDLKRCNAETAKLQKKEDSYKQEIKTLKNESKQLQAELTAAQARASAPTELSFLRNDPQLAQSMGLDDLPADDTQALIQTVAVLAQLDNLKRLWEVLKDRCEAEKRPASADENALLQAALDWHNHNWRSLPYRLINPAPASHHDYETQARSRHVTKGETVAATHLPGIADGSGKALCKALVQTK